MRISDTNHSKVVTLEEFVNVLNYGNPEFIKTDRVSDQSRLLDHLFLLLSRESVALQLRDQELFVWPGVEQFFTGLCAGLDPDLELKANEVFQQGWSYIAGFIGSHDAQHVVRRLLVRLGERFPRLQEAYELQLESLVTEFLRPTIGKFLDAHSDSMDQLSTEFPTVYELFVSPLTASPIYKGRKLFTFYCNPWIYNPIMEFLAKQDCSLRCSERYLKWLEERLRAVRPYATAESWDELVNKSRELLDASDGFEALADGCSGLLGEIKTAFHLVRNVCQPGDALIFLEDDNRRLKKNKQKNCDLMIVRSEGQDLVLVEVKTKSPRHGVEESDAGVWDNFFSNFSNSVSYYLDYLDRNIAPIFGLNLRKTLPLFFAHECSGYGIALPVVCHTLTSRQPSVDGPAHKWKSEKKIETLLRALFLKPLVLEPTCVPLASDDARLFERRQLTENVIRKDWVRNTMRKAIKQLQETCERREQEGYRVSKLYVALDLSLSYRLLQDPFSYSDGNMKGLAAEKLEEIFQPFRDELSVKGLDLELLLP